MRIINEITRDDLVVARLATAYTLLALAPYDNWSHEGDPAEMAAYVVQTARNRGDLGFLHNIILGDPAKTPWPPK